MKKNLLKTMLLLCALIAGSGTMWGTNDSYTATSSDKPTATNGTTSGSVTGTNSISWSYSVTQETKSDKSPYVNHSDGSGWQLGSSNSPCKAFSISTSGITGTITQIQVVTGSAGASSNINVTVGGNAFGTQSQATGSGSTVSTQTFTGSASGAIIVSATASTGAFYFKSVTVTYTTGGGSLTTSDLALTGAPIDLDFDLYTNSTPQVINYTTSSTGAVTVSSSSYISTSVDSENKRITITPTVVTPSAQTITVSQAADATYAAGSATFTVTVANSAPVINASNVNIEATATSGIISYSITNPEGGASLTASETEDWISDVTVDSENSRVTFTTTTNTAYIQRTGTITLTYGDDLATKDITVNQSSATPPGSKHEWDLSTNSYSTSSSAAVTWTSSYATMTNSKGSGNDANNYLPTTNTSSRFYKNNNLTINPSSGYKINGVVFTATTEGYASTLGSSSWSNATAYVSSTKVTVIPTNGDDAISATIGGTCGFTKVEVYYELLPIPSIVAASTSIAATTAGTDGTISITYNNITSVVAEVHFFEADGTTPATYDWIEAEINGDNDVEYLIDANAGAARTAYMKVYALDDEANDVYSPLITVTQAGIDYAPLPFNWAGGTSSELTAMTGVTANGLGDYAVENAPYRVKMDGVGDYIQIKTNAQPVKVLIGIKMVGGSSTSKIKVQESADGTSFTDVEELTISGAQNAILNLMTTNSFATTTRYVKIIKSVHGSNIGVGPIQINCVTASIGATGWTTFASASPLDLSGIEGGTAYYASAAKGSSVTMTSTTATVPAGEGLALKGTAGATVTIPVAASGDAISGNKLVGCTTSTGLDANANFYVLVNNGGTAEFQCLDKNGATIPAGKAYLNLEGVSLAPTLSIVFEDETSGIDEVRSQKEEVKGAYYNLAGQRVAQPTKGLYIVNGKKVVIK